MVTYDQLRWNGLTELRTALRNLPDNLTMEAAHILIGTANSVAVRVRGNYGIHNVTGTLQNRVGVEETAARSRYGVMTRVVSRAPHAHIFEKGVPNRRTTRGGTKYYRRSANRGRMPRPPREHRFIPTVADARERMYDQVADLLRRHGLTVTRGR
jgi:hypothetical protein